MKNLTKKELQKLNKTTNTRTITQLAKSAMRDNEKYFDAITKINKRADLKTFTAKDIAVHGATLKYLCKYGILEIVGQQTAFIPLGDEDDEPLYKKVDVNIYARTKKFTCIDLKKAVCEYQLENCKEHIQKYEYKIQSWQEQIKSIKLELEKIKED